MLRKLREQWWYMLLWLPLVTFLGFLSAWLWITVRIVLMWTVYYDEAPKWGFFTAGGFAFFLLFLIFFFPRKPARSIKVTLGSIAIVALILCILFYANTAVITYQVNDVDGGPIKDIVIKITHHATGVCIAGFPGETLLRTDSQGKASIRVFRNEECDAQVNDFIGEDEKYRNHNYSGEYTFFLPMSAAPQNLDWPLDKHDSVEHSYMMLGYIAQGCMESPLTSDSRFIHIYLCHGNTLTLRPYFNQLFSQISESDADFQKAKMISLGGSIESFNHLDTLLSAVSRDDGLQDSAVYSLEILAMQISEISTRLKIMSPDSRLPSEKDWRVKYSFILYRWLNGNKSEPPTHLDRIAYIKQRMDQATIRLIDTLHPLLLKKKRAYSVLRELQEYARPAMRFYPEVFEKGTTEAKGGALSVITIIAPSPEEVAFLIRSKNPSWIKCASGFCYNRSREELSKDLKTLQVLKSQESDPQIIAAFDNVIKLVMDRLLL